LGEPTSLKTKLLLGGTAIAVFTLLILGPLLLVAFVFVETETNPPVEVSASLTLGSFPVSLNFVTISVF